MRGLLRGLRRRSVEADHKLRGHTVLDAEGFINETFVCQLSEQRCDHVCASVDDDERVDRGLRSLNASRTVRCGRGTV